MRRRRFPPGVWGFIGKRGYLLGEVIELADDVPGLTDAELRDRLAALAERARVTWVSSRFGADLRPVPP
ncbi:MAG TPA: hypothetical protein VGL88_15005 [Pseudonocardiaceae bacterium]